MKHCKYRVFLATFLSIATTLAFGDPRVANLFEDVSEKEAAEVVAQNEYFMKKHGYMALRSRIVRVNTDLLHKKQPIHIEFFEGDSLTLNPIGTETSGFGNVVKWRGVVADSPFSKEDLSRELGSEEFAKSAYENLFEISISASLREYDPDTRASLFYRAFGDDQKTKDKTDSMLSSGSLFFGIRKNFSLWHGRASYKLLPVDFGGAYHLLYQINPDRIANFAPESGLESQESKSRRQQAQDFMDSLGNDPAVEVRKVREMQKRAEQ